MSERADVFLVERGYAKSRAEAQAAIRAGLVRANGEPIAKPSQRIDDTMTIAYQPVHDYVSRGALKLAAALDHFKLSPKGKIALDLGASTGGFTQVLLGRGAARVYAIDVGHGQLHASLAKDERVVSKEGVNARDLSAKEVPEPPEAVVADMSFISLKIALAPALAMAAPGAWAVVLVKPQFEMGFRGALSKAGLVREEEARQRALDEIAEWIGKEGWSVTGTMQSPIAGGAGNIEYLLAAVKPA